SDGLATIMCASMNRPSEASRTAATTSLPNEIGGTKCPSITSRCQRSMPPASASRTCCARLPKSAVRMEGAMRAAVMDGALSRALAVEARPGGLAGVADAVGGGAAGYVAGGQGGVHVDRLHVRLE